MKNFKTIESYGNGWLVWVRRLITHNGHTALTEGDGATRQFGSGRF